jgi:hypothetical protein
MANRYGEAVLMAARDSFLRDKSDKRWDSEMEKLYAYLR